MFLAGFALFYKVSADFNWFQVVLRVSNGLSVFFFKLFLVLTDFRRFY